MNANEDILALQKALCLFLVHERQVMCDLKTAHNRGEGSSEFMREDDRDMRAALAHAFENARELMDQWTDRIAQGKAVKSEPSSAEFRS